MCINDCGHCNNHNFCFGRGLATKTSVSRRVEDRTLYLALKEKNRFSQILLCQIPLESNLLFLPRKNGICLYIILVRYTISKIVIIDKLKENNTFLRKYPVSMQNIFDCYTYQRTIQWSMHH